jgi:hypothetical protein
MNIDTRVAVCAACDLTARLQRELWSLRRALSDWERCFATADGPTDRRQRDLFLLRQGIAGLEAAIGELGCEHQEDTDDLEDANDVAA